MELEPKDEIGHEYLGHFPDIYCQVIDAVSRDSIPEEFVFHYCIVKKVIYSTKGRVFENEIKEEQVKDVDIIFDDVYEELEGDDEEEELEGDDGASNAAAVFAAQIDRDIFLDIYNEYVRARRMKGSINEISSRAYFYFINKKFV